MSIKVALVQLAVSDAQSRADREERAFALAREAASEGAQLVMLPELWPMGAFNIAHLRTSTSDYQGFINGMSVVAKANGIWLHAGSDLEVAADGCRYNTAAVFNPAGDEIARYRKLHLWGGAEIGRAHV